MFNSKLFKVLTICNVLVISGLLSVGSSAVSMYPEMPQLVAIKGVMFLDANRNGINDDLETRNFRGVFINVLRSPGATQAQYMIQDDGKYEFAVLPGTAYKLQFVLPKGTAATTKGTLANDNDSDINPDGQTDYIEVYPERMSPIIVNAGVVDQIVVSPKLATIGDYIWEDSNKNGAQDKNEKGIPGVFVNAYTAGTMNLIATTTSDSNGKYNFNIPANKYDFKFFPPKNFKPTSKNSAFNNNDSNIDNNNMITGLGLFAGEVNNDYDAGYVDNSPKPIKKFQSLIDRLQKFVDDTTEPFVRDIFETVINYWKMLGN
jgi:serine-aspartate repeat-containing protein C/D/E